MEYLLDTHAFIWWLEDSDQLSGKARSIIENNSNKIYLSLASQWEMAIKVSIGRLEFPLEDMRTLTVDNGFEPLTISTEHIIHTSRLPLHHRDPFDRLLIAQAQLESLCLISKDRYFPQYDVELIW